MTTNKKGTGYFSGEIENYGENARGLVDGAEVVFIVDFGKKQIPLEVKYQRIKKPEISRSLASFIKKYQPQNAFVINLSLI